jgi:hypothetical protein
MTLNWRETARHEWESPRPPAPNGSTGPGTDYGVTIWEQATWPQDGSTFAGWAYEQKWVRQGPGPGYRDHVIIGHSQYPAPGVPQPNGFTYAADGTKQRSTA